MKKVVLVDGSSSFAQYLGIVIKRLGYETISVHGSGECHELLLHTIPEMIMSEVRLPDGDGIELCRLVKNNPETSKVHVVFVTTRNGNGTRKAAMESGATDFLTKPVKMRTVFNVLEHHIGYRRRKRIRTPYVTAVQVDAGAGSPEVLETASIGEGGMFLKREEFYPVGKVLDLRFSLNGSSRSLAVKGEVMYALGTRGEGISPGVGIRFVGLDPELQSLLSSHIENWVTGAQG